MSFFLHLEYAHITNYSAEELIKYNDNWCKDISDSKRQKESQLARLLLDKTLKKVTNKTLHEAVFQKDELGRPYFENYPDLYISITHSHGHVWAALANAQIGIDFEKFDPNIKSNLKHAFDESDWMKVSKDSLTTFKFFSLKESYSKMIGQGFNFDPPLIKIAGLSDKSLAYLIEIEGANFIFTSVAAQFEPAVFLNLNQYFKRFQKI